MRFPRQILASVAMAAFIAGSLPTFVEAQGVTTGAIGGKVTDEQGAGIPGVQVSAVNRANGFSSTVTSRVDGRYLIPNLEVGTYDMTFRRIGFDPIRRRDIIVALSQVNPQDVQLTAAATELSGVTIIAATTTETFTPTNTSVKTIVTDTTLQRLPSLSRNIIDMVRVSPQVSTSGAGYSAANINRRARDPRGRISLGLNPDGPADRQIGLIRLERPGGAPIALIANYAMHGTALGPPNKLISGDAPGKRPEHHGVGCEDEQQAPQDRPFAKTRRVELKGVQPVTIRGETSDHP